VGELERYEDSYRLCYARGPEGIIVETMSFLPAISHHRRAR